MRSAPDANNNVFIKVGGFFAVAAALSSGLAFEVHYAENEPRVENVHRPENQEPSSSAEIAHNRDSNYKSPMLTLEHFHDIAQHHPEADILLHEDAQRNQTLHAISKNQQASEQPATLDGISVVEDPHATARQKAREVFSNLVKEKVETLKNVKSLSVNAKAITALTQELAALNEEASTAPLSAKKITQVTRYIPAYEKLPRPNEAGMRQIFKQLVLFNEPEMVKKIEATKQEHQEKEVAALTNAAQVCNILDVTKTAQGKTYDLLKDFRQKIAAVYQENSVSDGENFYKSKTDFGLVLSRYQKIAEELAMYAGEHEKMLCNIEKLPVAERLTEEEGNSWLCAMEHLVAENKELTLVAKQKALYKEAEENQRAFVAQGNDAAAALWKTIANVHANVIWAYSSATEEEIKNNSAAAQAFYKTAKAYKEEAKAWRESKHAAATLSHGIAETHRAMAVAYSRAVHEERVNNLTKAQIFYKIARTREQQIEALAQKTTALEQEDQDAAKLWEELKVACDLTAKSYGHAILLQAMNPLDYKISIKSAAVYERNIEKSLGKLKSLQAYRAAIDAKNSATINL